MRARARPPASVPRQGAGHVCPDIQIPGKGTLHGSDMGRRCRTAPMPDKRGGDLFVSVVLPAEPGKPSPGAGAGMKTRTWAAPRAAYLLTAAMADNTEQVGAIVPRDHMN